MSMIKYHKLSNFLTPNNKKHSNMNNIYIIKYLFNILWFYEHCVNDV